MGPTPLRTESSPAALFVMLRGMFCHKECRYNRVMKGEPKTPGELGKRTAVGSGFGWEPARSDAGGVVATI